MIFTKIEIGGTEYNNFNTLKFSSSANKNKSIGNFSINFDSPFGRHKNSFIVGDEIKIWVDNSEIIDDDSLKFVGLIEQISFSGDGTRQNVNLTGRDYTARLQDVTVEPVVYSNSEVSTIVKNIIDNSVISDITYTNVDETTKIIKRIAFNHQSLYEAISQLAELSGYIFYIDQNKDLHFEKKDSSSSGVVLNENNILNMQFDRTREETSNIIWVYGDRTLAGFKEILNADGGSVFTLLSRPHSTNVEYLGSSLKGGVYELVTTPTSGTDYLINFYDRKLIFQSGTDLGYSSIPVMGGSVLVTYDREVPIVKYGINDSSISVYGPKTLVIQDKKIKDPNTAIDILKSKLESADPFKRFRANISGWYNLIQGDTILISLKDYNLNNELVEILSIEYFIDKDSINNENIIQLDLSKKILDITDKIKDLDERIKQIESQDIQDSDYLTRYLSSINQVQVVGSYWEVSTRTINGSAMIWGNATYGVWGTDKWGTPGSAFNPYQVRASGGYY